MPIESAAGLSAFAAICNSVLAFCKYGIHYADIPDEIEQFRHAVDNLDSQIRTSKRLRRSKSAYLDGQMKTDVDEAIERSESVLTSISKIIEGCRADLDTTATVSAKKRLDWILRGYEAFMSRSTPLNSCIQILTMHISRMDAALVPSASTYPPPPYVDSLGSRPPMQAPSVRRKKLSSTSYSDDQSIRDISARPAALVPDKISSGDLNINSHFSYCHSVNPPFTDADIETDFVVAPNVGLYNASAFRSPSSRYSMSSSSIDMEKEVIMSPSRRRTQLARQTSRFSFSDSGISSISQFSAEKEVYVSPSSSILYNASNYSFDGGSCSGSLNSKQSTCVGDYCVDDDCLEHNKSFEPSAHFISIGMDSLNLNQPSCSPPPLPKISPSSTIRSQTRRKIHKSGFI